MIQTEILLIVTVVGLYLYDSMRLLYYNEGILTPKGKDEWSVCFGTRTYRLLGKEIFFPNPFFPHRPLFRLSWEPEGCAAEEAEHWTANKNIFGPLVPMVWQMALALFILLPLGFFTRLGDHILLTAILLLYVNIIGALLWLWFNRATFNLSRKKFAALAFESLVCSPFALNIIRTLSLNMHTKEDLLNASRRLQNQKDWSVTRTSIIARLDELIDGEESGSERMTKFQDHRQKLMEQNIVCQVLKSS